MSAASVYDAIATDDSLPSTTTTPPRARERFLVDYERGAELEHRSIDDDDDAPHRGRATYGALGLGSCTYGML